MIYFKKVLPTILICIFIFTFNISEAKSYKPDNSRIKTSEISKFIPKDHELLLYSKYKNNEINRFIKQRFTNNEIKKINMIKNGLISFFGLNIKDNLNDIYDGEFILSTFKKENKKRDILIVFKTKKESDLNQILNIDDSDYNVNQIVEIFRPKTLNLINHIMQTDDNIIICASNKDLIDDSLKAINNNKIRKAREEQFKYYESRLTNKKLFIYSNKQFYDFINLRPFNSKNINYLTQFYFDKNKLVLNSFSLNNNNFLNTNNLNSLDNNDIKLLTNDISIYLNLLNNSVDNEVYKKLFEDISKITKDKILITINNNDWVVGFKRPINNFSINKLTALNNFHQDKFRNDDYIYTIFSKNNLELSDQKIIYKSEPPVFVYESNDLTFLSNNLSELLNTLDSLILDNIFQAESRNLIINDELIIRNFNNQIYKGFLNIFDSLNYFTADGLSLTLDTIETKTTQKTPEIIPSIQLKTYINFS